jgi:hypothetical protein
MSFEKPSVEAQGEAGVEQESKLPTAENLQEQMAALKVKVEAAKLQKEADVEKKFTERESLIGEAKSNVELLAQANETLDYFTTMQELGNLDQTDTQKLEELKTLVASLEQKRDEINQKIEVISKTPEVLGKIQDAAQRENVQQELKQLEENFHSEFYPKVDKLIEEYDLYLKDVTSDPKSEKDLSFDAGVGRARIDSTILKVREQFGLMDTKTVLIGNQIEVAWRQSENSAQFYDKIAAMRSEAGMFDGKKKAILDLLLEKVKPLLPEALKAENALNGIKERDSKREAEKNRIRVAFKDLLTETGPINDKYEGLIGTPQRDNKLAYDLLNRFNAGLRGKPALGVDESVAGIVYKDSASSEKKN